ncbi:phosphatase PAP2 family protein [Shewanella eurypsychrophilus]|uniref:undecaprenyl-diphosphate phosphatase n=2 Tax=Shewanellaceae TaxID=267890 RepID=A0ABX6VCR1_9GAMM|nr:MULTISPECIES: phosphatase PAP2 family protein [Shewanella]QFU25161.1 phosphatase PAP2 family protein [Shewanella sp. YLB-09]QPG60311.1 phosphatase PAP2 family protein [Shewanella eurypsychrophilus]
MPSVIFPLMLGWLILLIIPGILFVSDASLFPWLSLDSTTAEALFWITSTGTAPYGVASVLLILLLSYRRLERARFFSLFLAISLSMCTTLGLNHYLKPFFNEARPNAVWLDQHYLLNTDSFYTLSKAERKELMMTAVNQIEFADTELTLAPLVKQHWQHEIGFAFPSGHTLFAITLTMVASYYLLIAGNIWIPSLLFGWSIAMGFSRMLLGMHWTQDVLASTFLGGIIGLVSLLVIHKIFPYIGSMANKLLTLWKPIKPS